MIKAYLKYRKLRLNAHGLHSPFVFAFYNEVIKKTHSSADQKIESLRATLRKDNSVITINDLGAGSRVNKTNQRKVSEIAKKASIPKKYGQLLRRIAKVHKVETVLELGTSLGIGTMYLAGGDSIKEVVSIEGCEKINGLAIENFKKLGYTNIKPLLGSFEDRLKEIEEEKTFDLIYIDGNHTKSATLEYFKFALKHSHDQSFIIFDDIHWNEEMEEAWNEICLSEAINVSMDLFRLGIVLKRNGQRKQDFVLKF